MKTWIALLRGVNVVGRRKLPMKELAAMLERDGLRSVRTYIQSGNVVFQSATGSVRSLAARIARVILANAGFETRVMVLSCEELTRAVRANPFPQAERNPKALHLFFLAERPLEPDLAALTQLRAGGDAFALGDGVFYLYTPQGFAESALHDKVERHLKVHATARNWRTANQLLVMAAESAGQHFSRGAQASAPSAARSAGRGRRRRARASRGR